MAGLAVSARQKARTRPGWKPLLTGIGVALAACVVLYLSSRSSIPAKEVHQRRYDPLVGVLLEKVSGIFEAEDFGRRVVSQPEVFEVLGRECRILHPPGDENRPVSQADQAFMKCCQEVAHATYWTGRDLPREDQDGGSR